MFFVIKWMLGCLQDERYGEIAQMQLQGVKYILSDHYISKCVGHHLQVSANLTSNLIGQIKQLFNLNSLLNQWKRLYNWILEAF